jgi:hypothetical protein
MRDTMGESAAARASWPAQRRDSDLFGEGARNPEVQIRFGAAFKRRFQTRDAGMDLAGLVGDLG